MRVYAVGSLMATFLTQVGSFRLIGHASVSKIVQMVSAAPKLLVPLVQGPVRGELVTAQQVTWEEHIETCEAGGVRNGCARCVFYHGMMGMLKKGRATASTPNVSHAWSHQLTFMYNGKKENTFCERPSAWGGPWGIGCFVCNKYGKKHANAFSTCTVRSKNMMTLAALRDHTGRQNHKVAIEMAGVRGETDCDCNGTEFAVSGLRDDVPRLDTFVRVGVAVESCASDVDCGRMAAASDIGTVLAHGGDQSKKIVPQCVRAIAMPVHELDQFRLRIA